MKNEEKYFSGSQVRALLAHRSRAPDATLCAIWAPWELLKKVPLSGYLNGFGLAVSRTLLGRVRLSRIRNLCLKGTQTTGRKSLVTLRPSLGVKRSEKWRAHVRIFLKYFCLFFLKVFPNTEDFGPFPCGK